MIIFPRIAHEVFFGPQSPDLLPIFAPNMVKYGQKWPKIAYHVNRAHITFTQLSIHIHTLI